jgi:hypothetical protein
MDCSPWPESSRAVSEPSRAFPHCWTDSPEKSNKERLEWIGLVRWYIFIPNIIIWVQFGGPLNGKCFYGNLVYLPPQLKMAIRDQDKMLTVVKHKINSMYIGT